MNKSEFIAKLAEDTAMKKADAEKFFDAFVSNVKDLMAKGDKLQIVGFGTFEAKERAAKNGVNPATGEKISIAACKVPAFKPAKVLKDELNK
ncbi:MAG TPA: HU family DNA-binding protein [Candidatus Borkfalkia excrementigallinarum]|uniref:HU family DNA-binding protein n=1 Tax=Candidatus Borkfalkia excrementigallinarum TaxID=2838506 RepID=A0A9D1ZWM8_9FIRM|nr:HU family DNA-binding protein [Candidatus Borkfalkia excrementigallinarum]